MNKKDIIFKKLLAKPGNNNCFECGRLDPRWCSVNNSIFVCLDCAGSHRGFGVNISFMRSIVLDGWDDKQLAFMRQGGNLRLKNFFDKYQLNGLNESKAYRYKTVAGRYYRDLIKSEIKGIKAPPLPSVKDGQAFIDNKKQAFYGSISSNSQKNNNNFLSQNPPPKQQQSQGGGDFFSNFQNGFKFVAAASQSFVKKTYNKVQSSQVTKNISKKIKNIAGGTKDLVTTGYDKSKVAVSKGFKKTKKFGTKFVGDSARGFKQMAFDIEEFFGGQKRSKKKQKKEKKEIQEPNLEDDEFEEYTFQTSEVQQQDQQQPEENNNQENMDDPFTDLFVEDDNQINENKEEQKVEEKFEQEQNGNEDKFSGYFDDPTMDQDDQEQEDVLNEQNKNIQQEEIVVKQQVVDSTLNDSSENINLFDNEEETKPNTKQEQQETDFDLF